MQLPNLMYDQNFKIIFKGEETRFYIAALLETILNQKVDCWQIIIKDSNIITSKFTEERGKITDCYIKYKNYNIIFECNKNYYENLYELKIRYLNTIYNLSYRKGEKKENKEEFILVNINDFKDNKKAVESYYLRNDENILTKKLKVVNINLVKIEEKWYNKVTLSKQEKLFLYLKENQLPDAKIEYLIKGEDVIMKLRDIIKNMSPEECLEEMFDYEEEKQMEIEGIKRYERKIALEEGKAEGIKEGKAEGIKEGKAEGIKEGKAEGIKEGKAEGIKEGKAEGKAQEKREMIESLYKENIPLETIAKASKLNINKVKEILMI